MKKILIVEDNKNNMYLMRYILEKSGFIVFEAENGELGIEKAKQELPDLILMDMQLPVVDGYEAATILKGNELTRGIPIAAVTAFAMAGDREKSMDAGCDEYIKKPIDPETFVDTIRKILLKFSD